MLLANMGLNKILSVSVPVLNAIYPIAIMLILLAMIDKYIKGSSLVYTMTIVFTAIVSVFHALSTVGVNIEFLNRIFENLPFYAYGLGWVVPAFLGLFLGIILKFILDRKKSEILEIS